MIASVSNTEWLEEIEKAAQGLPPNYTVRIICPKCSGGSSKERCLSISPREGEMGIWFRCWRDSCKWNGVVNNTKLDTVINGPRKQTATPKFWDDLVDIPQNIRDMLQVQYHLDYTDLKSMGARWGPKVERLWLPIVNGNGYHIGGTARSFLKDAKPKTLTYLTDANHPLLCWYPCRAPDQLINGSTIVIVEDQMSGARSSKFQTSAALLGTHFDDHKAEAIIRRAYRHVVLCLDGDAHASAIKIAAKIGSLFDTFQVRKLKLDFKNDTDENIKKVILGE